MDGASRLVDWFREFPNCLVAFSGGVDSAVVAQAAFLALGDRAVAITGQSAAVATNEMDDAQRIATFIGLRHQVISTLEGQQPNYVVNDLRRCYFCKTELYGRLGQWAAEHSISVVVSGTNHDDLGDYRPGLQAAKEHHIRHPLVELGYGKQVVRNLAHLWNLPVAEKPASPCLASRIAYGVPVTVERLKRIEEAEKWLRDQGCREFRVRCQHEEIARVEIAPTEFSKFLVDGFRLEFTAKLRALGFKRVTLDLEGFQSGSLYQLQRAVSTGT